MAAGRPGLPGRIAPAAAEDTSTRRAERMPNGSAPAGARYEVVNLGLAGLAAQAVSSRLERLSRLAPRGCGLVLVHTHLFHLDAWHPFGRYYAQVETAARAQGLHVAQSFPHFRGAAAQTLWVRPDDSHPNAEAHRRLARALVDGLVRLPERCGMPASVAAADAS